MWPMRSHKLEPLTVITFKKKKFECTKAEQDNFENYKRIVARNTLLNYPYFNETFKIHTYAIAFQFGEVISQKYKPISIYSRKLTNYQQWYTVSYKELLSIVKTLKEYRTILLGQRIIIYTDNKNLTCKNFNTNIVLRWRLILKEYGKYPLVVKNPLYWGKVEKNIFLK